MASSDGQGMNGISAPGLRYWVKSCGSAVPLVVVSCEIWACEVPFVGVPLSLSTAKVVPLIWISLSTPLGTVMGVVVPFVCGSLLLSLGVAPSGPSADGSDSR